ncbi:MAG TPA: thymidine kinase [Flavipsychrobacter sp.]|nr:thymidine kinase [Flavipsychrobacter sp.]
MFIEPQRLSENRGWIEVVCGSMFSGKTEELMRRLRRAQIAHQKVAIFKPAIDRRYDEYEIVSHDAARIQCTPVENSNNILLLSADVDVVGIDEAQFFDIDLPEVAEQLAVKGTRVIVAGLDMDYTGKPFGSIPVLLAKAEYVTKLHAICVKCGNIASFSFRRTKIDDQILLGEKDVYEPRCRSCFNRV